jgi:GNAT superfamily N-acetyltransferase
LVDLLVLCRASASRGDYPHIGDLLWSFRHPTLDPERNVSLWVAANRSLVGFTKVDPPSLLWICHPNWRTTPLPKQLFDWGTARIQKIAGERGEPMRVRAQARDDNAEKIAFLKSEGFVRSEDYFVELVRALADPLQAPELPTGFRMRSGPEPHEVDEYVAMHRDAWGPSSTYTASVYKQIVSNPGYRRALNPVVVAPDGAFAASCICWLDATNRVGEIEPLGTRPSFRRLGLARAVVLEAINRLRARGAETALVYGASVNEPAQQLYASTGFRPDRMILNYVKES